MPAPKRITDLTNYTSILPYASELFGVYQALIGWRSKRQMRRLFGGATHDTRLMLQGIANQFTGRANPQFNSDHQLERCDVGLERQDGTMHAR